MNGIAAYGPNLMIPAGGSSFVSSRRPPLTVRSQELSSTLSPTPLEPSDSPRSLTSESSGSLPTTRSDSERTDRLINPSKPSLTSVLCPTATSGDLLVRSSFFAIVRRADARCDRRKRDQRRVLHGHDLQPNSLHYRVRLPSSFITQHLTP